GLVRSGADLGQVTQLFDHPQSASGASGRRLRPTSHQGFRDLASIPDLTDQGAGLAPDPQRAGPSAVRGAVRRCLVHRGGQVPRTVGRDSGLVGETQYRGPDAVNVAGEELELVLTPLRCREVGAERLVRVGDAAITATAND